MAQLTIEEQEIIYEHYGVELYSVVCSPLRDDNNPSFSTKQYGDNIKWSDFGAGLIGKSCYDFIMEAENCDFKAALSKAKGILQNEEKASQKRSNTATRAIKDNTLEVMVTKKWESWELDYWKDFGITKEQLESDLTFPLRILKVNNVFKSTSTKDNPKFVYYLGGTVGESFKVYSPKDKDFKWISNRLDLVDYENPTQGKHKNLIVLSSRKDKQVFDNMGLPFDTTSSLSESNFKGIIKQINNDFKHYSGIYSLFDFDDRGLEFAQQLYFQSEFKIKPIIFGNILNYLSTISVKDIAELKRHGDKELLKLITDEIKRQT